MGSPVGVWPSALCLSRLRGHLGGGHRWVRSTQFLRNNLEVSAEAPENVCVERQLLGWSSAAGQAEATPRCRWCGRRCVCVGGKAVQPGASWGRNRSAGSQRGTGGSGVLPGACSGHSRGDGPLHGG